MADGCAVADPHAVLDIAPGATRDELRQAFRRLAKETHPDHGGDRRSFEAVRRAYVELLPGAPEADAETHASDAPEDVAAPEAPVCTGRPLDARTATVMGRYRTTVDLDLTAFPATGPAATWRRPAHWRVSTAAYPAPPTRSEADRGAFSSLLAVALAR